MDATLAPGAAWARTAVKADAYGHGAVTASKTFIENGADRLDVATLIEAVELRNAGIDAPILNLGYTPDEHYPMLIKNSVAATVYALHQTEVLNEIAGRLGVIAIAHVKVDTGMERLGFQPSSEAIRTIVKINSLPNVEL